MYGNALEGRNKKMKRKRNEDDENPLPTSHPPPSAIATEGTLSSYFPITETALNTISECILKLLRLQSMFFTLSQFRGNPSLVEIMGKSVDDVQEDVLDIRSDVVCLIENLFKGPKEGGSLSFFFPTTRTAFSAIYECIQQLVQMQCCIHQMAISLSHGESVDKEQHEVLRIKTSVVRRIYTLFELPKEEKVESSDEATSVGSYEVDDYEDEYEVVTSSVQAKAFIKEEFKWSSANELETKEKERYLCLANGYEIWCLDLKQSSSNNPDLPKTATLSLLGEQLPASVGLFKFGSDAYLIGGQKLPAPSGFCDELRWGLNPGVLSHYKDLCYSLGVEGSSRVTHRLFLAADREDGTLNFSHPKACCGFVQELNKPKVWPIVEKIDGKLHVIDSVPNTLEGNRDWIFTHEVHSLSGCDGGWKEIRTIEKAEHIISHVVVGHRIYALTGENMEESDLKNIDLGSDSEAVVRDGCRFLEFDAREEKWKGCTAWEFLGPFEVKRIRDIICIGVARCAFKFRSPEEEGGEPLYVLVALTSYGRRDEAVVAMAYLVTSTGQVVCYQHLSDFFKGQPLKPRDMEACTMIYLEDEEGPARTMCSVFTATILEDDRYREYLFINTFSVEKLETEAVSSGVGEILAQKAREVEIRHGVELDFVRFEPKNWYVYETDTDASSGSCGRNVGWQACFLTPP